MNPVTRRQFFYAPALAAIASRLTAAELAKIKLGVTTDEIDEDVNIAAQFLEEFHLHWAEVRNIWGKYNTAQPADMVREARTIFDKHKLKTSVLGTGFFKIALPDDSPKGRGILDNQWSLLDGAMERAKILGTDRIRVFAFTYDKGVTPSAKEYSRIYELVGEAARRAQARNFRLALENVGGSYVSTGKEASQLLAHVKNDNLGLTWDPNNAGASGERAYPEGYKLLDPQRIFHVHLRDYKKGADGKVEWCAVGDGEMDNVSQIRSLLSTGYKDAFTLETHYKHPQGKAAASRTSLTALLKVIEKV